MSKEIDSASEKEKKIENRIAISLIIIFLAIGLFGSLAHDIFPQAIYIVGLLAILWAILFFYSFFRQSKNSKWEWDDWTRTLQLIKKIRISSRSLYVS